MAASNYDFTQVLMDYDKAKVKLAVGQPDHKVYLSAGQARRLALQLLTSAEEAEQQRVMNLHRAQEEWRSGDPLIAEHIATENGFTEKEWKSWHE